MSTTHRSTASRRAIGGTQQRAHSGARSRGPRPHGAGGDHHRVTAPAHRAVAGGHDQFDAVAAQRDIGDLTRLDGPAARSRSPRRRRRPLSAACGDHQNLHCCRSSRRNRRWSFPSRATATAGRGPRPHHRSPLPVQAGGGANEPDPASSAPRSSSKRSRCRARPNCGSSIGHAPVSRGSDAECTVRRDSHQRRPSRHAPSGVAPRRLWSGNRSPGRFSSRRAPSAASPGAHGSSTTRPPVPHSTGANARSGFRHATLGASRGSTTASADSDRLSPSFTCVDALAPGRRPWRSRPDVGGDELVLQVAGEASQGRTLGRRDGMVVQPSAEMAGIVRPRRHPVGGHVQQVHRIAGAVGGAGARATGRVDEGDLRSQDAAQVGRGEHPGRPAPTIATRTGWYPAQVRAAVPSRAGDVHRQRIDRQHPGRPVHQPQRAGVGQRRLVHRGRRRAGEEAAGLRRALRVGLEEAGRRRPGPGVLADWLDDSVPTSKTAIRSGVYGALVPTAARL